MSGFSFSVGIENITKYVIILTVFYFKNSEVVEMSDKPFQFTWKHWVTIITIVLVGTLIVSNWKLMTSAWDIFRNAWNGGTLNWVILGLVLPVQLGSYLLRGEITYLYLKSSRENVTRLDMARLSLEVNFVDHFAVFSGLAGMAYYVLVMSDRGVSKDKSTMAQTILYLLTLIITAVLILLCVIYLMLQYEIPYGIISASIWTVVATACLIGGIIFVIVNQKRITKVSLGISSVVNKLSVWLKRNNADVTKSTERIESFFERLRRNYFRFINDKKVLGWSFLLMLIAVVLDALLVWMFFASLGYFVNPAVIYIAFAVAGLASIFMVTPGGIGAYEPIMIAFLAAAGGIGVDAAIAGTLFARASLLIITLVFGYVFYQDTVIRCSLISPRVGAKQYSRSE